VPTLGAAGQEGQNKLVLSVAQVGGDDLDAAPIYRIARFTARYPVDGIKDPPDGILPVRPEQLEAP
jgi:hypothetical protein